MSSLSFAQTRDAELAWIDGQLIMEPTGGNFKEEERMDTDDEIHPNIPVLEHLPPGEVCISFILSKIM